MKLLISVIFVLAAAVNSHVVLKHHQETSADVEHKLKPVVHPLEDGKHKLVHNGPDGKEVCTVCNPFAGGCGCSDIVAIRCELKRLKQKLGRLQKISHPLPTPILQVNADPLPPHMSGGAPYRYNGHAEFNHPAPLQVDPAHQHIKVPVHFFPPRAHPMDAMVHRPPVHAPVHAPIHADPVPQSPAQISPQAKLHIELPPQPHILAVDPAPLPPKKPEPAPQPAPQPPVQHPVDPIPAPQHQPPHIEVPLYAPIVYRRPVLGGGYKLEYGFLGVTPQPAPQPAPQPPAQHLQVDPAPPHVPVPPTRPKPDLLDAVYRERNPPRPVEPVKRLQVHAPKHADPDM